ncbi:MAG: hypothetical protein KC766_39065, partial [Myxococcales bacterium]|nr:hypothetical protein [Myxococcales bacterium]
YVVALAAELERVAQALLDAWSAGFAESISEAGESDDELYPTLPAALGAMVQQAAVLIELIRGDKLAKPLGDSAGGVPQPEKAESQFSQRGMQDILDNLDGVRMLLFGAESPEVLGLSRYLERLKPQLSSRLRVRFEAATAACAEVRLPLTEAVVRAPELLRSAEKALGDLQRMIQVDVLGALSVSVGFSGNDGD